MFIILYHSCKSCIHLRRWVPRLTMILLKALPPWGGGVCDCVFSLGLSGSAMVVFIFTWRIKIKSLGK